MDKNRRTNLFWGWTAVMMLAASVLFTGCPNAHGNKPNKPVIPKYTVTFNVDGGNGTLTAKIGETEIKSGNEVEANKTVIFTATPDTGYKVKGWTLDGNAVNGIDNSYQLKIEKAVTVTVSFKAKFEGTVKYTVEHWQQNVEGNDYTKADVESKYGKPDEHTQAEAKPYDGFTAKAISQVKINADESTVIRINYDRNEITLMLDLKEGKTATQLVDGNKVKGRFGADVSVAKPTKAGYTFSGWIPELPKTFPAENNTHTAQWAKEGDYTITYNLNGGTDNGGNPVSYNVETETITLKGAKRDGYTFKGWYADTAFTGSAVTEIKKGSTGNKTFWAKWQINEYPITFNVEGGTGGTLKAKTEGITETDKSPINVERGKQVTFTAKASDCYRVKSWTLDGKPITEAGTNTEYKLTVTKLATVSVRFELIPETAILTLSPEKLSIKIEAKTGDDSDIQVEGCTETTLKRDELTELHATGTRVVLKGKITELNCNGNQLTALNVQGLTALEELLCRNNQLTTLDVSGLTTLKELGCNGNQLTTLNVSGCTALQKLGCFRNRLTSLNVQGLASLQMLGCHGNQLASLDISGLTALKRLSCYNNKLNVQATTELLNALPTRGASDDAKATLYTEKTEPVEDNCKDYNTPAELKTAFEGARGRHWKLQKEKPDGTEDDI